MGKPGEEYVGVTIMLVICYKRSKSSRRRRKDQVERVLPGVVHVAQRMSKAFEICRNTTPLIATYCFLSRALYQFSGQIMFGWNEKDGSQIDC